MQNANICYTPLGTPESNPFKGDALKGQRFFYTLLYIYTQSQKVLGSKKKEINYVKVC